MLVVAFNVGQLFFSLVPSLNDVCEPFALKKKRITHVAFTTWLLNKLVVFVVYQYRHVKNGV